MTLITGSIIGDATLGCVVGTIFGNILYEIFRKRLP